MRTDAEIAPAPASRAPATAVLVALTLVFAAVGVWTAWLCDDAYITFRTVDNFVGGYGLRWNVIERVQAYTHPLWMLLFAAAYAVTREAYFTGILLGLACSTAAVWIYVRRIASSPALAAAGVLALISSKAFVDFTTSGLENPLAHLLLAAALGVWWREADRDVRGRRLLLLTSLLVLTRVDLALLMGPLLAADVLSRRSRLTVRSLVIGSLPLVAWEAFSVIYYGFPVPNTAYAKLNTAISGRAMALQGWYYVEDLWQADPTTALVLAVAIVCAIVVNPASNLPVGLGVLLYCAYVVGIGGDFMRGRFFTPPFFMGLALLSHIEWRRPALVAGVAAAAIVPLALTMPFGPPWLGTPDYLAGEPADRMIGRHGIADERGFYYGSAGLLPTWGADVKPSHGWSLEGLALRASAPRTIVHGTVGFMGYHAGPGVHIIDCNALTEPLLARLPVDTAWRIGHFSRRLPLGYVETIETGRNHLPDSELAMFYERLALITRGPLWSVRRFRTILAMNRGQYAPLLNGHPVDPSGYPGCY